MTQQQRDLMFLRNIVHGAPVPKVRLAAVLKGIDDRINPDLPPRFRLNKGPAYYDKVAEDLLKGREV